MSNPGRVFRAGVAGLLAACTMAFGCAHAAALSVGPGETAEITLSEAARKADIEVDGRRYSLALKQIVDSRCPANAKCIWAGELSARISIERPDQGPAVREITLGESTAPSADVLGLRLELVRIDETSVTFTAGEVKRQ